MHFFKNIFSSKYFIIFLLTFVNGLSMTMLFPVLPYIVKSYGQPEVILGLLLGTFSLFQFLAAPILGALSDTYGRKPVLMLTQFGTFLSWVVLGCAYILPNMEIFGWLLLPVFVVFLSRVFDGITGGNASVAQAVLADMTQEKDRSKIFGMNGAVFGLSLLIGPALGSLSVSFSISFLGTAILGAIISLITLCIMYTSFKETLACEDRKKQVNIKFGEINMFAQIYKWGKIETVRYALIMKIFMFTAFVGYTSISALYLMDFFGFSASNIGYYLTFTGSFLIFHQSVTIRYFLRVFGDRKSVLFALGFMSIGFLGMGLTTNIIIFTSFYFIAVLGISLNFTTLGALFSRSADKNNQGEILGMVTGLESLISIGVPIIVTLIYGYISFSVFILLGVIPIGALLISQLFFSKIEYIKA